MSLVEPIAFTVTRYRCPTCPRTGSSKARIAEHHARCWFNPEARGCKTCVHFRPYEAGDCDSGILYRNDEPEHCAVGESLTGQPACSACSGSGCGPLTGLGAFSPCPDCDGTEMCREIKPGPIVHCGEWEAKS